MSESYPMISSDARERRWIRILLAVALLSSFVLKLNHLDHPALKGLDESFHAVVARNLLKHPLKPTLIDEPYLDVPVNEWQMNHIWLHKPVLPMWQIAMSFLLLGVNAFALRLPSAILSTAAAGLTYLIGKELLDRRAALIGAALQAFTPAIFMLAQGYIFSDHVDVALLFWVELAMWLLVRAIKSGRWKFALLAGVAQGLAFLCKTYPALIVTAVAIFIAICFPKQLRWRDVLIFFGAAIVTVAPWMIYCAVKYPVEFRTENLLILRHLNENVEGFAGPWDRLIFDYSLRIFFLFYPAVIVAAIVLAPRAWREKHLGLWLLYAWGFGVLVPHTIAITKTPTATLVGWPPMWLLLGCLISRAISGDVFMLVAWTIASLLAAFLPGKILQAGFGYPEPRVFAGIARQTIWVAWHVLAAIALAWLLTPMLRRFKRLLIVVASIMTFAISARMVHQAWRVTQINQHSPDFRAIGNFAQENLPANAVLLVDEREKLDYMPLMFYADRTSYPLRGRAWRSLSREVARRGAAPFVITDQPLPLRRVFVDPAEMRAVYEVASKDLLE